jgi:uncharacterized membrane protein YqjE
MPSRENEYLGGEMEGRQEQINALMASFRRGMLFAAFLWLCSVGMLLTALFFPKYRWEGLVFFVVFALVAGYNYWEARANNNLAWKLVEEEIRKRYPQLQIPDEPTEVEEG